MNWQAGGSGVKLAMLLTLWLVILPALASPTTWRVSLREHSVVTQSRITLADVLLAPNQLDAATLQVDLGPAPRIGNVEKLTRTQIEALLRRRAFQEMASSPEIIWGGAASVAIRTQTQVIPSVQITDAALQAVRQNVNALKESNYIDVALSLRAAVPDTEIPMGEYVIQARPLPNAILSAHLAVWIDIVVRGNFYRSVVVGIDIDAKQKVWLAKRAISEGEQLTWQDFIEGQDNAFTSASPVAQRVASSAQTWRATQALQKGQVLLKAMMAKDGSILRGDRVRVISVLPGIKVESVGIALRNAAVGQKLELRLQHNNELVTGRVREDGVMLVE